MIGVKPENLEDLLDGIPSVAILGMAKNVGKTTVLNYLTSKLTCRHGIIGVVSVGREGVRQDFLTGAAKPSIHLPMGAILATGRKLISLCQAGLEILEVTPFHCPFGELVIARVRTPGLVELAGPVRIEDLKVILKVFREKGAGITLVDGALDRKAAGVPGVTEGLILSTGTPVAASMEEVIARTVHQVNLLSLPRVAGAKVKEAAQNIFANGSVGMIYGSGSIPYYETTGNRTVESKTSEYETSEFKTFEYETLKYKTLEYKTLLGCERLIAQRLQPGAVLALGGTLEDTGLHELMDNSDGCREVTLLVRDPFRLFLEPGTVAKLELLGWKIKVLHKPRLLAVTASSKSESGRAFAPKKFLLALRNALAPVPVFDVCLV